MRECLVQYYRCPERYVHFAMRGEVSATSGYFKVGDGVTCYGGYSGHPTVEHPGKVLHDALEDIDIKDGVVYLPFDPMQVIRNFQSETYVQDWRRSRLASALAQIYYLIRPALPVKARRHLQKFHLRNWDKLPFPHWPVDCSVDGLHQQLLLLALSAADIEQIPFIWFWPDSASACAIMTHDVETKAGRDLCSNLMDIDDSFGVKSSFQVIPEQRYTVTSEFLNSIRERGFEVLIHDLNHDGHLYRDRQQFLDRAAKINAYRKQYEVEGFRAGILYRKQLWYDALQFSYDMSVPNVAHLDPQRGGCCTVMPYFLGNILELPVTTTQDYTLFHILNDYSTRLWQQQIDLIMRQHGLMSFIVHPDYLSTPEELRVYEALLSHLVQLRENRGVWITTPGELNRWWRQRAKMRLVENGQGWRIEGPGSERACIAYAHRENDRLSLTREHFSAVS